MVDFKYKPDGEIIKSFMKDDTFFRGIRGPVGSGKSVCCCVEVFVAPCSRKKPLMEYAKVDGLLFVIPIRS